MPFQKTQIGKSNEKNQTHTHIVCVFQSILGSSLSSSYTFGDTF